MFILSDVGHTTTHTAHTDRMKATVVTCNFLSLLRNHYYPKGAAS